jgi:ribosomal protein S18 acetylase RimI-like enzyme
LSQGDALAAIAHTGADRLAIPARIAESRDLFLLVAGNDFYINRLGVSPRLRCRGLDRATLLKCLVAGQALGLARFVLDVAANKGPAIRLYRSVGFSGGGDVRGGRDAVSPDGARQEGELARCARGSL